MYQKVCKQLETTYYDTASKLYHLGVWFADAAPKHCNLLESCLHTKHVLKRKIMNEHVNCLSLPCPYEARLGLSVSAQMITPPYGAPASFNADVSPLVSRTAINLESYLVCRFVAGAAETCASSKILSGFVVVR